MVEIKDGKINAPLLSYDGMLSERLLSKYDYKKCKSDFEDVVDCIVMNRIAQSMYYEQLDFKVDDNLNFIVFCDDPRLDKNDNTVFTLDRIFYDKNMTACKEILHSFKSSWDRLSEVERYIIKCLYFDDEKISDEEIIDRLLTYKNKYQLCKKSAYLKMDLLLNVDDAKAINNSFKHIENALKYQSLLEFSDNNDRTIKLNKENN